jgi:hypothetical protein
MRYPTQFNLAGLLQLVALSGAFFGLCYWIEPVLAIPIAIVPFCLLIERMLRSGDGLDQEAESELSPVRIVVFFICALSTVAVASLPIWTETRTVLSPLPILSMVFLLLAYRWPSVIVAAIPVGAFLTFLWPITRTHLGPIPMRATVLLVIGTTLSVVYLVACWPYGVQYAGVVHARSVIVINALSMLILWVLWVAFHRDSPFGCRIAFGTLLFYWLFWCAFPYVGQFP